MYVCHIRLIAARVPEGRRRVRGKNERDWYLIVEEPAPASHLAHPEGCAALRIVLLTVPRVSRACEHFPDAFGGQVTFTKIKATFWPWLLGERP